MQTRIKISTNEINWQLSDKQLPHSCLQTTDLKHVETDLILLMPFPCYFSFQNCYHFNQS